MKKLHYIALVGLSLMVVGCVGASVTLKNVQRDSISTMKGNVLGTYSDYDKGVVYNPEDKLYHYVVYVGGTGSCDGGALLYAKPKLDKFMKENNFSTYNIVKAEYVLMPMSKCVMEINYKK